MKEDIDDDLEKCTTDMVPPPKTVETVPVLEAVTTTLWRISSEASSSPLRGTMSASETPVISNAYSSGAQHPNDRKVGIPSPSPSDCTMRGKSISSAGGGTGVVGEELGCDDVWRKRAEL